MASEHTCCICFLADNGDAAAEFWVCSTCQTKCHLNCISRWAQSNHNRFRSTFSCPVCRQVFDLTTLPGASEVRHPFVIPRPIMLVNDNPLRPSMTSFIASVLQATSHLPTPDVEDSNVADVDAEARVFAEQQNNSPRRVLRRTRCARQPCVFVVTGTGPVHVERMTVINRF